MKNEFGRKDKHSVLVLRRGREIRLRILDYGEKYTLNEGESCIDASYSSILEDNMISYEGLKKKYNLN